MTYTIWYDMHIPWYDIVCHTIWYNISHNALDVLSHHHTHHPYIRHPYYIRQSSGQDYERNGRYTGFPAVGLEWQKLENGDMRRALGMAQGQTGVLVRRVDPCSAAAAAVSDYDIVLAFDGVRIANDGTVPFRSGERISFSYLVSQKYVGERATLELLQKGKRRQVEVTLQAPVKLVPFHNHQRPPSYFICAGEGLVLFACVRASCACFKSCAQRNHPAQRSLTHPSSLPHAHTQTKNTPLNKNKHTHQTQQQQ